ncbi:glucoamylase [Thiogranum longum]|uniref:Glucoamylase n=1 Tax=Thiogranum longum TaxID=1537524 RepID=A0A4R1HF72_9GAMM|nr:glycoside hydrolase family 15 protein [Thiogranum longum]TCK18009.1 glucoamylase [Thiogranum longum]
MDEQSLTAGLTEVADHAPGKPGIPPTWSGGRKNAVGCSLGPSRLWFTLGRGIINEVYYPRVDLPQIRDLGFIVADGAGFWVEVKRLNAYTISQPEPGIPAYTLEHRHSRFTLTLRISPDAQRDVLLIECRLQGDKALRPFVLLAPRLGGTGYDNHAATAHYRGRRVLWAEQGPFGLALAAVDAHQHDAIQEASAGFVGSSDGWQDFNRNGSMRWRYQQAGPGNVALTGGLPRHSVLALGFASSRESAATVALSALPRDFGSPWQQQIDDWRNWHSDCGLRCALDLGLPNALHDELKISAMVLRTHQDQIFTGAMIASLSIPWGETRNKRGGYHLVWPRDLVESAGALLVLGADDKAREILRYLIATQLEDGHWYQNQWLGGKPFWQGTQLDEIAFPVLLAAELAARGALDGIEVGDMVCRALMFIAHNGPATDQDRWEENAGVNTFTLAICIAALVSGADFLDDPDRETALAIADFWNSRIESWTAVYNTALARQHGVNGYYIRTAPPKVIMDEEALSEQLPIKNRLQDPGLSAAEQISTDFLQLVRFGLRRADDPLVTDSVRVIDALLRVETPNGPAWYRYNGDGYGEHRDGSAFDGTGHGRPWPLLTGERGHYELLAGNDPLPYLGAMAAMTGLGGMLPEQVWDSEPVPKHRLYPGRATGSAMPLVWAHAEFIKLAYSRAAGHPVDRIDTVWRRYAGRRPKVDLAVWSPGAPVESMLLGESLCLCLPQPATIRFQIGNTGTTGTLHTTQAGLGMHRTTLPVEGLATGESIHFTIETDEVDGALQGNHRINIVSRALHG